MDIDVFVWLHIRMLRLWSLRRHLRMVIDICVGVQSRMVIDVFVCLHIRMVIDILACLRIRMVIDILVCLHSRCLIVYLHAYISGFRIRSMSGDPVQWGTTQSQMTITVDVHMYFQFNVIWHLGAKIKQCVHKLNSIWCEIYRAKSWHPVMTPSLPWSGLVS